MLAKVGRIFWFLGMVSCTGPLQEGKQKQESPGSILSPDTYVIYEGRDGAGVFAILDEVLSLAQAAEKGLIKGLEVNLNKENLYYSPSHGSNWFHYYFSPLTLGTKADQVVSMSSCPRGEMHIEDKNMKPKEVHALIQKYLKVNPTIMKEVENFEKAQLQDFVIGIHYRGTDKISEAPRVAYEKVKEAVLAKLKALAQEGVKKSRIFVATDEQAFLDYMKQNFKNVVYLEVIRSKNGAPVHFNSQDPYQVGKEALLDCLLLSKTHYLIRTSSNLSRWSTYFNPELEVLEISKRY